MQVLQKLNAEALSGVQSKVQIKELCSTPFEQTFECRIDSLSDKFNVDQWARSFSIQKFDNSSVEKLTLHFYVINGELIKENLQISGEESNTWKELTTGISSTTTSQDKFFLCSKSFEKQVSTRQKYDAGFQYENKINTGNFSVVVKTDQLQPETLNALRINFLCAYNQSIVVIHLNFPQFEEVEKWLGQINLIKDQDYFLVDTLNNQSETGAVQKLDDHILIFKENQDLIKVINLL